MLCISRLGFLKLLSLVLLSWSSLAAAITLGTPQLQSKAGEPLRVEIPIRVAADEQSDLTSLTVALPNQSSYERLGISQKILGLNPQAMVYRNRQEKLMILVETVNPVPLSDDPFLDVLVNLRWASGSLTKTYTLLLGDVQKVIVKPGQTLSEIAAIMAPQLDGATLDQTIMALYKANPDAFASGSINRLAAGAELTKPSQALLRSISPAEANQFVADANEQWLQERDAKTGGVGTAKPSSSAESSPKDRLKIGSSADGSQQERRYTEELVVQEKMLEQTKARVAELEKNIADLQKLLDRSKEKKAVENNFGLGGFGPAIFAISLIALTGLLLWGLARHARSTEAPKFEAAATPELHRSNERPATGSHFEMPARAKALFEGIDLDLSKPAKAAPLTAEAEISNPLADTLRVKLNLARAYVTIEDFSAAKRALEEVLRLSNTVDPAITIEAQGLLAEISHRNT